MILRYFIITTLLFSIIFSKNRVFKYYTGQSVVTVDDITFDLGTVLKGSHKQSIDTVFMKIKPVKGHEQNIFWHQDDVKSGPFLKRIMPGKSEGLSLDIKGRSRKKFNKPILLDGKKNIIALPLRARQKLSIKDRIMLSGTKFRSNGVGRSTLLVSVDKREWKDIGYEMVFSSKEKVDIQGSKVFFSDADELDTVYCEFLMKIPDRVYIDNEFPIGLSFSIGENALWGDLAKVNISVNGKRGEGGFDIKGAGTDSLTLIPRKPIISSQNIQLSNVPVIKQLGTDVVSITMTAKTSDPDGNSNFHKVWRIVHSGGGNILKWKKANATTNLEKKYFFKDAQRFEGTFAIFLEGEGFEELKLGDTLQFRLISDRVYWRNDEMPTGKNFDFFFSKDKMSLICIRDEKDWSPFENRGVRISNLNFYTDANFTGTSAIEWSSSKLEQGKKQLVKHNIVVAKPIMLFEDDNYLFSNDQNPSITNLVLQNDTNINVLKRGDILVLELSERKLHFNKKKKDRVRVNPPYLTPLMSGSNHQISFIIERDINVGEIITMSDIPLLPIGASEKIDQKISGGFKIKSTRMINKSEDETLFKGESFIHISEVDFFMQKSVEYIKNQNRSTQIEKLPEIRILNGGVSKIFKDSKFKLYIEVEGDKDNNINNLIGNEIELILSNGSNVDASLSKNQKYVEIQLNEGIPAGQHLSIQGAKIELTKQFDEVSIGMVIESGNKILTWKTPQVLTFSSPYFQSSENQVFYPSRSKREMFSVFIDMRHLQGSFEKLNGFSVILPKDIPLEWSTDQENLFITGPGRSYLNEKGIVSSDKRMITIRKNGSNQIDADSLIFSIGGLIHDKLYYSRGTKSFNLQISIDGGKTICAIDPYQKRIVSDNNLASIYADKIITAYFPFKKGKINGEEKYIALEINSQNKSKDIQWDLNRTNIKSADEYSGGFLRSFNFEDPVVSPDISKISFHIKHDKYNQGVNVGLIGFNDAMTVKNIFTTENVSLDDICLTLLTPYGEKKYYESKGLVTFEKRKVGDKEIELTVGLKNLRKDLADPKLRDWYWMPDNNFALLDKAKYSVNRQKNNLKLVETILFDHYSEYKEQVEYDWIFWWYLSWVKVRADELNVALNEIQKTLRNSDFKSDFEKSKRLGFYGRREPGLDYDYEEERKKEFENAYALYLEAKESNNNVLLFKVEDEVFSSLNKRGMTNYIRAANYSLLGQIGDHFNDNTEYKISTRRATKTTTYPERILYRARREISQASDRKSLQDWSKIGLNRIELIDGYQDYFDTGESFSIDTDRSDINPIPIDKKRISQYASKNSYIVTFKWYPEGVSEKFDWTFNLKSPKTKTVTSSNGSETMIMVGKQKKEAYTFNQDLTLHGGAEYELHFSPKRTMMKYAFYSIIGGALTYAWTL